MRVEKGFAVAILVFATSTSMAVAQPPDSLWSRTYGGDSFDACFSVQQTLDGGYILGGNTYSFGAGGSNFWLVKTDANGDSLWSRTFGGSNDERCYSIQQTSDSGYILAGSTESFGAGYQDFWLVKTNAYGDSLWSRTFGGSAYDWCYSVRQTSDGGFVLAGVTVSFGGGYEDFWLVKANAYGDSLWSCTFGGSSHDRCRSVQQTSDGGYVLAGYTYSFGAGETDFWLVKTDANGDSLWSRTFGGDREDQCYSIHQTLDGGYILAGETISFGAGYTDFWLVKTNSIGDSLWSRTFGGSASEGCYSVQQTSDGGCILAGYTGSFGARYTDFWLVKMNSIGDSLWSRTFGGSHWDFCFSVQQILDWGYVLAGWTRSFGAGESDIWLVKTGPELAAEPFGVPVPAEYTLHQNWPNPFNPMTEIVYDLPKAGSISLRVFDILGREVTTLADGHASAGSHRVMFDGSGLASGIYFYSLQAGDFAVAKKMVLLK
jgi:hypothetical protein